jgi:hypothetical protein
MREMIRPRIALTAVLAITLLIGIWLWWTRPRAVDMASYAPADSLLYLEANSPSAIADALERTEAWKIVGSMDARAKGNTSWLQNFVRWTGLGPVNSVILARSQVAVVMTDLGVAADGESLTVKPEGALIIETHTSRWRIETSTEEALQKFANRIYGGATLKKTTIDDQEFLEWVAPEGSRQVVATVIGSVIIVGNGERPVRKVVAVVRNRQPSLIVDNDLRQLRLRLDASHALALGYVPSKSSPHLLSVAMPMLLGRAPDNAELGRLIDSSAAKLIWSLGWSCRPFDGGIEDRYLIGIPPAVIDQIKEGFAANEPGSKLSAGLREGVISETHYQFSEPVQAWQGLRTAVSSHVDTVSAILFSALLRSALVPYGISEPEKFLSLVKSPIVTVRIENSSNALLIAQSQDEAAMRGLLTTAMGYRSVSAGQSFETLTNAETETSVRIGNGSLITGPPEDIDKYIQILNGPSTSARSFDLESPDACAVSYADDSNRVRSFFWTLLTAQGVSRELSTQQEMLISSLPYSTTETVLDANGFVRTTRSPLGQFSTILPLIFPAQPAPATSP